MVTNKSNHRLSTVDNAISLLSLFLKYDSLSLVDMEQELQVSKTAAFRLAVTLADRGFLVKDIKTKRYNPGPILFQLIRKFQLNDIVSIAQPFIQKLSDETKESVYLSIRSGHRFIFISGIDSTYHVKVSITVGTETELYMGAAGKIHLAYMPPSSLEKYIKQTHFKRYSPKTILDPQQLKTELSRIRENGYSISVGEWDQDAAGIAAPIWGIGEEPAATIGIYLPLTRFGDERKQDLVKLMMENAKAISEEYKMKQHTVHQ